MINQRFASMQKNLCPSPDTTPPKAKRRFHFTNKQDALAAQAMCELIMDDIEHVLADMHQRLTKQGNYFELNDILSNPNSFYAEQIAQIGGAHHVRNANKKVQQYREEIHVSYTLS